MSAAGIARLVHAGLLPERELASVSDRLGIPGGPGPMRVLTATIAGGIEIEILPGRGLDIGRVRRRGEPIAWVSPVADARALDHPQGDAWIGRFIGGLLATCGLRNIGPAEGGEGQHGDYGHLPADRLGWRTESLPDGARITVTGTVASERIFGDSFRVDRAIVLESTSAAYVVEVRDEIVNTGVAPARLSMLYHLNLGAPVVVPGTTVAIDRRATVLREPCDAVPAWELLPDPSDGMTEAVFEHHDPVVLDVELSSVPHAVTPMASTPTIAASVTAVRDVLTE